MKLIAGLKSQHEIELELFKKSEEDFKNSFKQRLASSELLYQRTECAIILEALELTKNNKDDAAVLLGISRNTVFRRLRHYKKLGFLP